MFPAEAPEKKIAAVCRDAFSLRCGDFVFD